MSAERTASDQPSLFDEQRANGSRRDYPEAGRRCRWSVAHWKKYGPPWPDHWIGQTNAMFDEIDRLRARVTELENRP